MHLHLDMKSDVYYNLLYLLYLICNICIFDDYLCRKVYHVDSLRLSTKRIIFKQYCCKLIMTTTGELIVCAPIIVVMLTFDGI